MTNNDKFCQIIFIVNSNIVESEHEGFSLCRKVKQYNIQLDIHLIKKKKHSSNRSGFQKNKVISKYLVALSLWIMLQIQYWGRCFCSFVYILAKLAPFTVWRVRCDQDMSAVQPWIYTLHTYLSNISPHPFTFIQIWHI